VSLDVLLLPGLDGTGELFRPFVDTAPAGATCRVVRYPEEPGWGYPDYVEFVRREHLPVRPFLVVGESFSGPVATAFAAGRPPGLRGVVLVNTFVLRPAWRVLGRLPWKRLVASGHNRLSAGALLVGFDRVDEHLPEILRVNRQVPPVLTAARLRAVFAVDVRAELRRIPAPVLYLRGHQDLLVPPWCLQAALAARRDLLVARLPGPHLLLQTHPRECWRAIRRLSKGPGSERSPAEPVP
jgi:pimeloyl-ACP methyl ester carboxylesterase